MKKIFAFIILSMILINSVSAFMPPTHKLLTQESLKNPIDTEAYRSATEYPSLFYAGNVLTDISVFFYYTARSKYSATHSPSFCRSLLQNADTPELQACAWGGCSHQPQDITSHTKMVPHAIVNSLLVNNIIHVFAEQKLDNWVVKNNPGLKEEAMVNLNDYQTCMPLFIDTLVGDPQYSDMSRAELEDMFAKFISEVQNSQTGYDTAFKTKSFFVNLKTIPFPILAIYSLFMFGFLFLSILTTIKILKGDRRLRMFVALLIFIPLFVMLAYLFIGNLYGSAFNNFITIIKPVSNLVPIGGNQAYIDEAVSNTKALLTEGEQWLFDTESSGFTALDSADRQVLVYDYIIAFVLLALLIWFIWFIFKRNKIKVQDTFSL